MCTTQEARLASLGWRRHSSPQLKEVLWATPEGKWVTEDWARQWLLELDGHPSAYFSPQRAAIGHMSYPRTTSDVAEATGHQRGGPTRAAGTLPQNLLPQR